MTATNGRKLKKIDFNEETGEILKATSTLEIDEDKLREEESLDGYYVIVTNEMMKLMTGL